MGVRLHVRSCWASGSDLEVVYELELSRILIGRGRGADVRLPHRSVSVRHATIELDGARYVLVDHDTTNGTMVEGTRVVPGRKKPLRDGDRIELGGFSIQFRAGIAVSQPTSSERTASLARRLVREALSPDDGARRPSLLVLSGPREGARLALPDPPARLVIGRGEEADLSLPDDEDASRAHAELELDLDGALLRDLGSKNGTEVGGKPVSERRLVDRDELRVGATRIRFEDAAQREIDALDAGEDQAGATPTLADLTPPPPPPDEAEEPEAPLPDAPPPPPLAAPPPRPRGVSTADMIIYVLAAAVFAVSLLGLSWLLRGG